MGLKTHKPVTAGQRSMITPTFEDLTKKAPEKGLTKGHLRRAGRSRQGNITVRRKGGGCKRRYRIIDFRMKEGTLSGEVISIEYDPNRTCRIALIKYRNGNKKYIIAPAGLKVGNKISNGENSPLTTGNCMPLKNIPVGTLIYNVQLDKNKNAQLARAAGTYAQILAKEGEFAHIKLPSGEIRKFKVDCRACIGQVGNIEHSAVRIGKAGKSRHMGRRPKVRGVVMNPIDHPLGGGEGRSSGGRHPSSPWGRLQRKTRKKKLSDKYIVKRRK
jgi:large subunit ribosomal protein L2